MVPSVPEYFLQEMHFARSLNSVMLGCAEGAGPVARYARVWRWVPCKVRYLSCASSAGQYSQMSASCYGCPLRHWRWALKRDQSSQSSWSYCHGTCWYRNALPVTTVTGRDVLPLLLQTAAVLPSQPCNRADGQWLLGHRRQPLL